MILEDALNAIDGCDDLPALQVCFDTLVRSLGYDGFSYIDTRQSPDGTYRPYFHTTCRTDFAAFYREQEFFQYDPVIARAARTNAAFRWSDCPEYVPVKRPGIKPTARRVMEAALDHGLTQGYVIPVHAVDPAGRPASSLISLFWSAAPELMLRSVPVWLRLVGLTYHERVLALRPHLAANAGAAPILTDREKDCMAWACRGKTMLETGIILGVAERTVKFHLAQAMAKMGVHSKFHAIAKAIELGLIMP